MSDNWYLYQDQQQKGPYTFEQLASEIQRGAVSPADMIWCSGMENWVRADQVEGLFPAGQAGAEETAQQGAYANQGIYYHDDTKLAQLRSWLGFVGIVTIIGGVISAISGLFAFIIGAIPGILTVILGFKLLGAKKYTDAMLEESSTGISPETFGSFIDNLRAFFKITGILIIISLVLSLLLFIFSIVASFFLTDFLGNLINLIN